MHIYVLSPLKIPFPPTALTPKCVQMTDLPFVHDYLKSYWHLMLKMPRTELTPIPSYSTLEPPPHQICVSPTVIPYLRVWFSFSFSV